MTELRASVILDLAGNLTRRARQYSDSLGRFSRTGRRHLSRLSRATGALGQGLDRLGNRYTALITGVAGVGAARMLVQLERRFTRLGIQANQGAEAMDALKREIFAVAQAPDVRVDPGEITAAIEAIVEKTGDLDFARENLRNIGLALQATGASGQAIGDLMAELQKMESFAGPQEVLRALDTLNVQGKAGAFTLQNLAALGPRVITAYASATQGARDGATVLREMGAALQVIRMGTGSAEQAATAFERLLAELQDVNKLKMLQAGGIQVFDPAQPGAEVLRPINEILLDILARTGGRRTLLGQVFGDESIRAFNALTPERIEAFMAAQGDGTATMQDAARAARDAAGAVSNLSTAWRQFADSTLTGPIQSAADALNSVEPATAQRWMQVAAGIAAVGAALVVVRKAYGAGKWLGGLLRGPGGGRRGAGGGGVPGAGLGVTPVFVTNMPMGGLGGGAGAAGGAPAAGRAGRVAAFAGRAGAVGAAAGVGYGLGSALNAGISRGIEAATGRENSLGTLLYELLNEREQRAAPGTLSPSEAADVRVGGKLVIEMDGGSGFGVPRIRELRSDNPNVEIEVDTGPIMAGP
jgi:hypothetical protein